MSPAELRVARKRLGLTQKGLAEALRMGTHGWQTISKWESDSNERGVPGPVSVAVEYMLRDNPLTEGDLRMSDSANYAAKIEDPAVLEACRFVMVYYADLGSAAPAVHSPETQHAITLLAAYIRQRDKRPTSSP